jgi:hypothetical protein
MQIPMKKTLRVLGLAMIVGLTSAVSAQAARTPIVLPRPDGFVHTYATGVDGGQVVGTVWDESWSSSSPLLWTNTATEPVSLPRSGFTSAQATGIDGGQVVGLGYDGAKNVALLWTNTATAPVNLHPSGFMSSQATGIDGGKMVGNGFDGLSVEVALLWTNGTASSSGILLLPEGYMFGSWYGGVTGIDGGRVVGSGADTSWSTNVAFLWTNGTADVGEILPLGVYLLNVNVSPAVSGIDGGQVVGNGVDPDWDEVALLWTNTATAPVSLRAPSGYDYSYAYGINGGQVVGYGYDFFISGATVPLLWKKNTEGSYDYEILPVPEGYTNGVATGIDANGNIVGYAYDAITSDTRAILWPPEPVESIANTFATDVTTNSATLQARLKGSNSTFSVWAFWGPTDGTNDPTGWVSSNYVGEIALTGATTSTNIAYLATNGLAPDGGYWYTFRATNTAATYWGTPSKSFITGLVTVEATTNTASYYPTTNGLFTIRRPATCTNAALTVTFAISGSAVGNVDYTLSSWSSVTFAAGESNRTITVTAIGDGDTTNEEVVLTLDGGANYPTGTMNSATVTILPISGKVWTGAASTDWGTAGNWSGGVPGLTDDVFIVGAPNGRHPTLNLAGGPVTVKSLILGPRSASILTVDSGNMTDKKLTVSSNVTIGASGTLTHTANTTLETHRLFVEVGGDLTITAGGKIDVTAKGFGPGQWPVANAIASHGGIGGGRGPGTATYGSLHAPTNCGAGGWSQNNGGGAVKLTVTGKTLLNGDITSIGDNSAQGGNGNQTGAGGSVFLTTGALEGTGNIRANGGGGGWDEGGGGRVAIVLTAPGASFTNHNGLITAYGGAGTYSGSAGTVYLRGYGVDPNDGILIVDNSTIGTTTTTLLSSNTVNKTVGEVRLRNNGLLEVGAGQTLQVSGVWSNSAAAGYGLSTNAGGTVAFVNAGVAGRIYGNTASPNLTIAGAGKVVSFQAGKTNTVIGTPAFSNVTLRSTLDNTQWHLRKPGTGFQDVGVVTVYDSHAGTNTTDLTFRGAVGSNVSDAENVNWTALLPKETMILLR